MSDGEQIQTDGEDRAVQAELSMVTPDQRAVLPANGSGRVPNGKPPRLQGIVIATNNPTTRRRVYEAYWRWPLLPVESVPLVVALYDNVDRRRKLARARDALEARVKANTQPEDRHLAVLTADEGVRQVEEEIRHKDTVIRQHLNDLGWTPTAMARLGIDLGRLRDRLSPGGDPLPETDVQALEQRVLDRLQPRVAEPVSPPDIPIGAGEAGERSSSKASAPASSAPEPPSEKAADTGGERVKRLKNQAKAEESPWEKQF